MERTTMTEPKTKQQKPEILDAQRLESKQMSFVCNGVVALWKPNRSQSTKYSTFFISVSVVKQIEK